MLLVLFVTTFYIFILALPIEEFEANPHTVMVLTSHGGHFGFVEGIYPNDMTWMNRTIRQLLQAFKSIL